MSLSRFGAGAQDTAKALTLAAALFDGPVREGSRTRAPLAYAAGICGVGLIVDGAHVRPALFIEDENAPPFLRNDFLKEVPGVVSEIVQTLFGEQMDWLLEDLRSVRVRPCGALADAGDAVMAGHVAGRLGAPVHWGARRGFLTAGHVALAVGNAVRDAHGAVLGQAVYVNDPPSNNGASGDIDVAVVEVSPADWPAGYAPGTVRAAFAGARQTVDIDTRQGRMQTDIYGYSLWFYASLSQVTYADVYLTRDGVTAPGDSGGPAWASPLSATVIGHVVAGGQTTTCIQDARRQIAKIQNDPQFSGLSF